MDENAERISLELIAGDEQAFDTVYKQYYRGLCAFASQYVTVPESEEIVQDVMMWLWENRKSLVADMSLKSLLFTIVRNKCLNTISHIQVKQQGKEEKPQICLMGATVIGRDLGPRVSSALTSGLTADCTQLEIGTHEDKKNGITYENLLYQIRPAFGGNIVATIVNPEHRPQMATVREGVMKKEILDENYKGEVVNHDVAKFVPETDYVVKVIDRHVEKAKHNLKGAPIVIAGGYGMGSKEGFDKLFELAKELHAEVGASRAAVDAGYADHDRQIGQTGVTVRPKLYIACGISGQIQHIAGMQDAGIIISVNSDPNAPINTIADYVINGTVEEVVPKLIKYYKKNSK